MVSRCNLKNYNKVNETAKSLVVTNEMKKMKNHLGFEWRPALKGKILRQKK